MAHCSRRNQRHIHFRKHPGSAGGPVQFDNSGNGPIREIVVRVVSPHPDPLPQGEGTARSAQWKAEPFGLISAERLVHPLPREVTVSRAIVAQSCTLRGVGQGRRVGSTRRSDEHNSALQQIENLRYTAALAAREASTKGRGLGGKETTAPMMAITTSKAATRFGVTHPPGAPPDRSVRPALAAMLKLC